MQRKLLMPVVLAMGTPISATHVEISHHHVPSTNSFEMLVTSWGGGIARQDPRAPCCHCHLCPDAAQEGHVDSPGGDATITGVSGQ